MNEDIRKHLEFIQQVISRMNSNSFQLKGWSVALVAGLFAIAVAEANKAFAWLAIVPIPVFWFLDAYYLSMERSYRQLYDRLRLMRGENAAEQLGNNLYSMKPEDFGIAREPLGKVVRRPAVIYFHAPLLAAVLLVILVLACTGGSRSAANLHETQQGCSSLPFRPGVSLQC